MALTAAEFKAVIKNRGYRMGEVAGLWNITPARLSQIARDLNHFPAYEFALWALVPKRIAAAVAVRRAQAAQQLVAKVEAKANPAVAAASSMTDVWDDLTELGSVFKVDVEQGEHLPEGCEGVVVKRERRDGDVHLLVRFAGGHEESFPLSYLRDPSCFLVATGAQVAIK